MFNSLLQQHENRAIVFAQVLLKRILATHPHSSWASAVLIHLSTHVPYVQSPDVQILFSPNIDLNRFDPYLLCSLYFLNGDPFFSRKFLKKKEIHICIKEAK